MAAMADSESQSLEAELTDVEQSADAVKATVAVLEGGEQIGTLTATFRRRVVTGETLYTADLPAVSGESGLYCAEGPPFWPVEKVVPELSERCGKEFSAVYMAPDER